MVEKLQAGADLMTPGLQRGPPFPSKAKKGALVAVASLETPSVPVAVGTCEIDLGSLDKVQGAKGRAVSILHWAGDELWSWTTSGRPGGEPPDLIEGWDDNKDDHTDLAEHAAAIDLSDQEGGVRLDGNPGAVQTEDASANAEIASGFEDKELTTKGMQLCKTAFLSSRLLNEPRD